MFEETKGKPSRNICVTDDHRYAPFIVITGFVAIIQRRVSLVEREMLNLYGTTELNP
jgi:hypothetical protein